MKNVLLDITLGDTDMVVHRLVKARIICLINYLCKIFSACNV